MLWSQTRPQTVRCRLTTPARRPSKVQGLREAEICAVRILTRWYPKSSNNCQVVLQKDTTVQSMVSVQIVRLKIRAINAQTTRIIPQEATQITLQSRRLRLQLPAMMSLFKRAVNRLCKASMLSMGIINNSSKRLIRWNSRQIVLAITKLCRSPSLRCSSTRVNSSSDSTRIVASKQVVRILKVRTCTPTTWIQISFKLWAQLKYKPAMADPLFNNSSYPKVAYQVPR